MSFQLVVKVTPHSARNQILGWEEGVLKVKIKGVPEKGKVNEELILFVAQVLAISPSKIHLLSGHTSRLKRLQIEGSRESLLAQINFKK